MNWGVWKAAVKVNSDGEEWGREGKVKKTLWKGVIWLGRRCNSTYGLRSVEKNRKGVEGGTHVILWGSPVKKKKN